MVSLQRDQFQLLQTLDRGKEVSWFSFPVESTERNRELPKANQNFSALKPLGPS